ncbi:hypothetical protein QVD17_23291 [Tagetes erecta]|uniref:Uncharacterized protein n=1 Tax=Tagetes erecta TaxID=13708 RepID=A0AAD8NM70_TARER|nr:hypothetical protein QVD17_23291 [Tagetes erecta]
MFYSQFILAKKGPLGTIWIAAHLERKLRKNQVADTDIGVSVDSILFPEMPIALRLSSHLLLGVVRIYSKKVNYLFDDCSEALLKVKQAFRSTAVDLPPEETTAPYHSITMPETFDLDDFELPDSDLQGNYVDQHISSKDQITLQDTMEGVVYSTSKFGLDERFGDDDASGLDLDEELLVEKAAPGLATGTSNSDADPQASVHANATDALNEELDEYDGDNEPVDYAQAPCTPGLWEEPNLSNIQETSACDDHHEPENHTIPEFAVKENLENASHQHHHIQFESHEKSLPHAAATEQIINDPGSTPFTEPHLAETVIPLSNDSAQVENLLNKNVSDGPPPGFQIAHHNLEKFIGYQGTQNTGVQSANDNHDNFVEHQGNQKNVFHLTTENGNFVSTPQHHASLKPNDSMPNSVFPVLRPCVSFPNNETNAEGPRPTEPLNKNFSEFHHAEIGQNHEVQVDNVSQREVQVENINSYANDFSAPVIQKGVQVENINSYTNDFPAPVNQREAQVENFNSYANDFPAHVIQREVHVENFNSYTNDFPAPVIQREVQVENINNYTNDLSAPEKRLALPHWLSDVPKSFVPESTPIEKDITSGKKRTFTESSMTAHSLNLNESSGFYNTNMTSQSINLNNSSALFTTTTTPQSLNLNDSSGFFTTSTTAQSLNLNQSSGPFTINMTGQSVMNDDDLLSSILVGRKSSILKVKPSPSVVTPSTKRRRATPKTTVIKRKVLMDDTMVLHGDTIRQQLTNTEDIRRLRKKAPCTRSEISMLEKQFWEDDIFSEPIFTGVSNKLASLHNQLYNLSKIVVSHNDVSLEGGKDPQSVSQNVEKGQPPEVGPNVPKENIEVNPVAQPVESIAQPVGSIAQSIESITQPIESPMVRDNHMLDNNMVSLDYYVSQQPQMVPTEHAAEPFSSEHNLFGERNAMEVDPKSFPNADTGVSIMPTEVEPPTHADVAPSDTFDMSAAMGEIQMDASLPPDAPGVSLSENLDMQSFNLDKNDIRSMASPMASEIKIDVAPVREVSEEKQDQDIDFRKNDEVVNEDAVLASNIESNVQSSVYNGIFGEEFGTVGAYDTEANPVLENVPLDERENPAHPFTFETDEMKVEDIPTSNRVDDDEPIHPAFENNTDFLNFDDGDDDEADAGGDYGTDVETTRVIDNSGWSSRTKAVAKYLQIMFDKEGEHGRNTVAVNNLLVGKTRKEASRMFFETLVLKTKDYIHVEQTGPFGNINVFPRSKLLKSDY